MTGFHSCGTLKSMVGVGQTGAEGARNVNSRGFAYIIAVLILGLLAFMGMFLMQSSSVEYSQAAMSVYATMAQQLAESAADEVFLALEKELKTNKKEVLIDQMKEGTFKYAPNDRTALKVKLEDWFSDFSPYVNQTNWLIGSHMTRAGFSMKSIRAEITDFRPIDHSPPGNDDSVFYMPKDRNRSFNQCSDVDTNMLAKDFYLSLGVQVVISLRQGGRDRDYRFQQTRDVKIINVGPIGRNFTLFSGMGVDLRVRDNIKNDFCNQSGRLVLWNHPFQSRVYLHGPALIGIENIDVPGPDDGAYRRGNIRPGITQAYQYSTTYNGLSYVPFGGRALWEHYSARPTPNIVSDQEGLGRRENNQSVFEHQTRVRGMLPLEGQSTWDNIKQYNSTSGGGYIKYIRGKWRKQTFLPAGPFCRFPWHYVPKDRPSNFSPNQIAETWPKPDEHLRLEHRWLADDASFSDKTRIGADLKEYTVMQALAGLLTFRIQTKDHIPEFSLTYGNLKESSGWLGSIADFFKDLGGSAWSMVSTPFNMLGDGIGAIWEYFVPPQSNVGPGFVDRKDSNFFPTNFKNFPLAATMKMKDVSKIPKDEKGYWILDGVYWVDSFETMGDVIYKGKGMIFMGDFVSGKPAIIRGHILSRRSYEKTQDDDHLTLVINPFDQMSRIPPPGEGMLEIRGVGKIIEASVFSLAGLKTDQGEIPEGDYAGLGMDPAQPTEVWSLKRNELHAKVNTIIGNYVNTFMNKTQQRGEVWVFHDVKNPFYFQLVNPGGGGVNEYKLKEEYSRQDEVMAHSVHLSPKIQHMHISGATK